MLFGVLGSAKAASGRTSTWASFPCGLRQLAPRGQQLPKYRTYPKKTKKKFINNQLDLFLPIAKLYVGILYLDLARGIQFSIWINSGSQVLCLYKFSLDQLERGSSLGYM